MARGIDWGSAVTSSGRVLSAAVGTIIGWPKRIPEPGTFPYGSAEDLDDLGAHIASFQVFSDPTPYDYDKVGMRRNRALLGSGLTSNDLDPAQIHEVLENLHGLIAMLDKHPQLASDPEFREMVFDAWDRAQLMTELIEIVDPGLAVNIDQLALTFDLLDR
jgi:hypothetical protein